MAIDEFHQINIETNSKQVLSNEANMKREMRKSKGKATKLF